MNHKERLEDFRVYLKTIDRNYTVEREGILRIINTLKDSYTLPQLYKRVNKKNVVHAKSTLYRNISLFVDAGLIREKRLPSGKKLYKSISRGIVKSTS